MTERTGRIRLLARMRVVHQIGTDTARSAYGILSKRASQLMLEGWQLDVDYSTDAIVLLDREGTRVCVEVSECWEVGCLAARPPSGCRAGRTSPSTRRSLRHSPKKAEAMPPGWCPSMVTLRWLNSQRPSRCS